MTCSRLGSYFTSVGLKDPSGLRKYAAGHFVTRKISAHDVCQVIG